MAKTKGTDIISLRKIMKAKGPETEAAFLSELTPDLSDMYKNTLATSWSPVEKQTALYQIAAQLIYPGDPRGMLRLGRAMAQETFSGVYKLFLRIPSIPFLMKRTTRIWRSYYDRGEAEIERLVDKSGTFAVRNFPELPLPMQEVICGHLTVLLEATGAKDVSIKVDSRDANTWRWHITWH